MTWESYNEITQIMYRYHHYSNQGRFEELGALFEHSTFQSVYPWSAEGHGVQRGAAEVTDLYRNMVQLREGLPRVQFVLNNIILDIDEARGTASSISYYIALTAEERAWAEYNGVDPRADASSPIQIMSAGRYEDTFARIDEKWWFTTRVCFADFTGDRSRHNRQDPVEYGKQFSQGLGSQSG
jgi:hypothetical protein